MVGHKAVALAAKAEGQGRIDLAALLVEDSDIMEVLFAKPLEVVEDSMGSRAHA